MLTKKREQKAKIELTGRTEKLESASNEVIEVSTRLRWDFCLRYFINDFITQWEAKVERCEEEFQKISKIIKSEFEQFEKNRVKEFKAVVTSYLEALAKHQVQVNQIILK